MIRNSTDILSVKIDKAFFLRPFFGISIISISIDLMESYLVFFGSFEMYPIKYLLVQSQQQKH